MGGIKGDTRSLDYSSDQFQNSGNLPRRPLCGLILTQGKEFARLRWALFRALCWAFAACIKCATPPSPISVVPTRFFCVQRRTHGCVCIVKGSAV